MTQPAMKATPPKGVTAPSIPMSVMASAYRLPENRRIPRNQAMVMRPAHFDAQMDSDAKARLRIARA